MARDWASQRRQTTGFSDFINLIESLSNIGERDKKATIDSLENIVKLSTISQTPAQIDNAQRALNNLSKASSLHDTTNTAYDLVQANLNNKRYEIDKFGSSVDQASDILNDPNFRDKAEDWRDLEGLRKSKLNDDGSYKYDSVSEMLSDEYSAVDNILGAINEGIGKGYRYNKNINFDDDDTKDKLTEYKKRLDKAIQASLGDGVISIDEANIIMSNLSKSEFKSYATERKAELKTQIKEQETLVQALGSNQLMNFLSGEGSEVFENIGIIEMTEDERKEMIKEAQTHLYTLLTQWKNWAGVDYKVKSLDTQEFGEFADDGDETVIEVDGITDMPEEDIKKLDEEKKKIISREEKREKLAPKTTGANIGQANEATKRAQYFKVHPSLQEEVDKVEPKGFGYTFGGGRWQFHNKIMDKSNRLKEKDKILDGTDKAAPAMNEFLKGTLNMNQAMVKGKYSDSDKTEVVGKKSRKKLRAFQIKFKNSGLSIEEFISQNKEEYYDMTKILKYGDYWFKNPKQIGSSTHYINLYD